MQEDEVGWKLSNPIRENETKTFVRTMREECTLWDLWVREDNIKIGVYKIILDDNIVLLQTFVHMALNVRIPNTE